MKLKRFNVKQQTLSVVETLKEAEGEDEQRNNRETTHNGFH